MHRDFFEFSPTHKLWLCCNHLPTVWGADEAIWRRILVVPFTVTIPEDEQDRDLPAKLWKERAGVLRWLVDGYRSWRKIGLDPPEADRARTDRTAPTRTTSAPSSSSAAPSTPKGPSCPRTSARATRSGAKTRNRNR